MPKRKYRWPEVIWDEAAEEALERARKMPPGPERADALKQAGILRNAANVGIVFTPKGRPPKQYH